LSTPPTSCKGLSCFLALFGKEPEQCGGLEQFGESIFSNTLSSCLVGFHNLPLVMDKRRNQFAEGNEVRVRRCFPQGAIDS
jgi:hypothetical protein